MSWRKPKERKYLAVVLALVLTILTLSTTTQAVEADTFHFSFKGLTANASFSSIDPSGCIVTSVVIVADDGRFKQTGKPEATSGASIFIDRSDTCNGVQILGASGFATLATDELQIDKRLDSATLNTTIEVFDFVSGTSFSVNISLNWTGIGGSFRFKNHSQTKTPGFKFNSHSDGTVRNAEVSGSVTDETTNFTPGPGFAQLGSNQIGEVQIIHF